jgi:hypothetical protein
LAVFFEGHFRRSSSGESAVGKFAVSAEQNLVVTGQAYRSTRVCMARMMGRHERQGTAVNSLCRFT